LGDFRSENRIRTIGMGVACSLSDVFFLPSPFCAFSKVFSPMLFFSAINRLQLVHASLNPHLRCFVVGFRLSSPSDPISISSSTTPSFTSRPNIWNDFIHPNYIVGNEEGRPLPSTLFCMPHGLFLASLYSPCNARNPFLLLAPMRPGGRPQDDLYPPESWA